jgi:hypothetical protein
MDYRPTIQRQTGRKEGLDMDTDTVNSETSSFDYFIFAAGAIGGVALDILSLYFQGFPTTVQSVGGFLGITFRVIIFMALTGFLACLYANNQLRVAFAIGIAAPSILVNIAASVQRPKEAVPTIPNISAPSPKTGAIFETPRQGRTFFGLSVAEAQGVSAPASSHIGQLHITLGSTSLSAEQLKASKLLILDETSENVLARTIPSSQSFMFSFPSGNYVLRFEGPDVESPPTSVNIKPKEVSEVTLPVVSKKLSQNFLNNFRSGFYSGPFKVLGPGMERHDNQS